VTALNVSNEGDALKLVVYEYISGGGYAGQRVPPKILAEGYAMLRSITADFKAAGHEVTVLLDDRLSKLNPPLNADFIVPIFSPDEPERFMNKLVTLNEAVYIIAPETGQILQRLVQITEGLGKISLNCTPEGIAGVADKEVLYKFLQKKGISTPKTIILNSDDSLLKIKRIIEEELPYPIILKPLDGASCSGMSIVRSENNIEPAIRKVKAQTSSNRFIAQSFINGLPASISLISNGQKAVAISLNKQQIVLAQPEEESSYIGGCVPLEHALRAKAFSLAEKLVESIPGLRGYIGVDIILSASDMYVVDVNPRLTTSYVGLHAIANYNIAQAIIDSITKFSLPKTVKSSSVAFFTKCQTTKPKAEVFQKISKIENLFVPPFPLGNENEAYALIMSKGGGIQEACLSLEEAKKSLRSIMT